MTKIAHLTSAHPRYDTRIFVKMCCSLSEKYDVHLIVADGRGDETKNGVRIIDAGKTEGGRFSRMTSTVKNVLDKAREVDALIYHLHDPELIPIGLKLKKEGKKVIFDAHEDVPVQIRNKPYLGSLTRYLLSSVFAVFEKITAPKFDAIVTATPFIRDKFGAFHPRSVDINNFPLIEEFPSPRAWHLRKKQVCYVGGMAKVRGILEIITAMEYTDGLSLALAGSFNDASETEAKALEGWQKVQELGFLDRSGIADVLNNSIAGLVTLHPIPNYIDALPVKMFEYMASGLPVIASDFPLWKDIIEKAQCGLCVDPLSPASIAQAINWIVDHPTEAEVMGKNGIEAIKNFYNWSIEKEKLFILYANLLKEVQ